MSVPPLMLLRRTSRFTSLVDVVEAVRGERAARREDRCAAPRDRASRAGASPSFSASASHFALVPNTVMPLARRHVPQDRPVGAGSARRRRARPSRRRRGRHEPVPHHPAAGREVEDPIVAREVGVQHELLEMLEQRAARAVHHALRQSRRARRVHDVQRMIERQPLEARAASPRTASSASRPRDGVAASTPIVRCRRRQMRHDHDALDRSECARRTRARARGSRCRLPA